MKLELPSLQYQKSFLEAAAELRQTDRAETEEAQVDSAEKFADYVDRLLKNRIGERLHPGYVASTELWLIDRGEYIGRIGLRHDLENEYLKNIGGHIGYVIRPSMRSKGYGTKILELGLKKAHEMGYDELMITCDEDNYASRKIIEKNEGEFMGNITDPKSKRTKRRYIINLTNDEGSNE